jgi:hypothetical protein
MSLNTHAAARAATAAPALSARTRRVSLAVLVLIVAEFILGMYVNLYVTVPRADHAHGSGNVLSNGPATLSIHAVLGLLLALAAIGVLVLAVRTRRAAAIIFSVAGLLAIAFAAMAGASFASSGRAADSMAMSVLTGVALLCYAANLYQ